MIAIINIQICLLILALGITNGFINLHAVDCKNDPIKCRKYSKIWHKWMATMKAQGAFIMLSMIVLPMFFKYTQLIIPYDWKVIAFWFLLWFNFSWTIYDLSINWVRWHYEKTGGGIWRVDDNPINAFIKKYLGVKGIWILRLILIIINIIIIWI